jgi:hypothetical protein
MAEDEFEGLIIDPFRGFDEDDTDSSYDRRGELRHHARERLHVQAQGRVARPPSQGQVTVNTQRAEVARVSEKEIAAEELRKALAKFAGVVALADRFEGQQPPIGTVLQWVKRYDRTSGEMRIEGIDGDFSERGLTFAVSAPKEYVFVAFRGPDGAWYTTGTRGKATRDWETLLKEIGDNDCKVVTDWTDVPALEQPDPEVLDPINWAKTIFAKKSTDVTDTTSTNKS